MAAPMHFMFEAETWKFEDGGWKKEDGGLQSRFPLSSIVNPLTAES
jgi:hypothetical protein